MSMQFGFGKEAGHDQKSDFHLSFPPPWWLAAPPHPECHCVLCQIPSVLAPFEGHEFQDYVIHFGFSCLVGLIFCCFRLASWLVGWNGLNRWINVGKECEFFYQCCGFLMPFVKFAISWIMVMVLSILSLARNFCETWLSAPHERHINLVSY